MTTLRRQTPYDPQIARQGRINPGNSALVMDGTTRLTGPMFGAAADTNFWTTATNGTSAAATLANGAYTLTSGTSNSGYASIITVRAARFLFVNPNLWRGAIRIPDTTEAGNTRYWGALNVTAGNPPTLNCGFYFSLDEAGALSVNAKVTGSAATSVASGSFTGEVASYTVDTNVHEYEILYFVMGAWFFVDGVLLHKLTPTTAPLSDRLDLNCYALSQNGAGGTESADLHIFAMSILRLGGVEPRPRFLNLAAKATTVLKYGPGTFHRMALNKFGAGNTITIYDNTSAAGTIIATFTSGTEGAYDFDVDFFTGLTVVLSGGTASDITMIYD